MCELLSLFVFQKLYRKDEDGNVYVYDLLLQRECLRFLANRSLLEGGVGWYDRCLPRFYSDWWDGLPMRLSGTLPGGIITVEEVWGIYVIQGGVVGLWLVDGLGIAWIKRETDRPRVLIGAMIGGNRLPGTPGTMVKATTWGMVKQLLLSR